MWRVQLCRVNCIFIDALAAKLITNMVIYFPFPPKYAFKLFLLLCCCLFAFWQTSLVEAETQFESRIIKVFQTSSFQFAYKVTALVNLEYSKFFIMPSVKISYTCVCSFVCRASHQSVVLCYQISSLSLLLLQPLSSSPSSSLSSSHYN